MRKPVIQNGISKHSRIQIAILAFVVLFGVYHLPEFLQNHFQKPLIMIFELGMLLFTITAFYFGKQWHSNGFKIFGLYSFTKNRGNLAKGVFIGVLLAILANMIPVWLHWSEISIRIEWYKILPQLLLFALGTLLPSIAEDILSRAYLRIYWPKNWKMNWLIPISASVYVLNHIYKLGKPDVILYLFILGLLLMWCYVNTGTLWLTLGIHWGSNIAYQFFTNIVSWKTIEHTGLENYVLAGCYAIGILLLLQLQRMKFFTHEDNQYIFRK